MADVNWGQVTGLSPLGVRIAGDSTDTLISLRTPDVTLSTGDKVVLLRVGSGWVLISRIVAA